MGVYDQTARSAVLLDPDALLRRLLTPAGLPFAFREWVETRTTPPPGDRDLTADRVAALTDPAAPDRPWLLLLEFQSQHDPEKLDVSLAEAARLRIEARHGEGRRGKYRVMTALVYLAERCPETVLDMTAGGHGTHHAPLLWEVAGDSATAALDAVAAGQASWGLLFWVPLMAGADDAATVARWRELASTVAEERQLGALARIALLFAGLAGRYVIWEKGLEDWKVTESPVMNLWIEKAQAETKLETTREYVLLALEERFPGTVSPEIAETVRQQPSLPMLREWFRDAMRVSSIEEFRAILRR